MALVGYTTPRSYLKIESIQIKNDKNKDVIITVSLYENSFKIKKLWSNNLEFILKTPFRGLTACQSVSDLSEFSYKSSTTEYVLFDGKIYQKINSKFELDSGLTNDIVFNTTDNKWYILTEQKMWIVAGPEVYTESTYNEYFSLEKLNTSNPFKQAYEFLMSQSEFSHCISDEQP